MNKSNISVRKLLEIGGVDPNTLFENKKDYSKSLTCEQLKQVKRISKQLSEKIDKQAILNKITEVLTI